MATSSITSSKAVGKFKEQAKLAASILGGQAIAAQGNSLIVPNLLSSQSATIQQVAKASIPLALGVITGLTFKNPIVRGISLGFGTQGVLEAIKLVSPDFNPQHGLGDPSHFVYTDENGVQQQAVVTPDGQIVAGGEQPMSLSDGQNTGSEVAAGSYAEDVEYV
jgi:hypothetical protein